MPPQACPSPTETLHDNRCYVDYVERIERDDDRRAELAAAAYSMIAERGIQGLSLRALARELGATTGLVSHHFLNRTELVQAALAHSRDRSTERANAVLPDAGPLELLGAILPIDEDLIESWRFALGIRMAGAFDPELAEFDATIGHIWDKYLPDLLEGITPDTKSAARYLVALVDGIALHAILNPDEWPPEVQLAHLARGFEAVANPPTQAASARAKPTPKSSAQKSSAQKPLAKKSSAKGKL